VPVGFLEVDHTRVRVPDKEKRTPTPKSIVDVECDARVDAAAIHRDLNTAVSESREPVGTETRGTDTDKESGNIRPSRRNHTGRDHAFGVRIRKRLYPSGPHIPRAISA
jgi:hypothetical protein